MIVSAIVTIDPGANGAAAVCGVVRGRDSILRVRDSVEVAALPSGMRNLIAFFRDAVGETPPENVYVVSEQAGFHRAGFSASASASFARNCGRTEMGAAHVASHVYGAYPHAWMALLRKRFDLPGWQTGAGPKESKARKAAIRDLVLGKFPGCKVTLRNADALALMLLTLDLLRDRDRLPDTFHIQE